MSPLGPEDWWDQLPEPKAGDSWRDQLGRPWDELPRPFQDRPITLPRQTEPTKIPSPRARAVIHSFPRHSRKPGGRYRAGQRSGDRKIPVPIEPVEPSLVLGVFQRRWRGKHRWTSPWRLRALAAIAVALSVPRGSKVVALSGMLPAEVLGLDLAGLPRRWVVRWLSFRRRALGGVAEHESWLSYIGSRGRPRQVGWSVTCTLVRAGLPGWRINQLLR